MANCLIGPICRLTGRPVDCPDSDFLVVRRDLDGHCCRVDVRRGPVALFVAPVAGGCLDKAFSIRRLVICKGHAPAIPGADALSRCVFVSDARNQSRRFGGGDGPFRCRPRNLDRTRGASQQADSVVDAWCCSGGVGGRSGSLVMESSLPHNRGCKCFYMCRCSDKSLPVTKVWKENPCVKIYLEIYLNARRNNHEHTKI